MTSPTRVLLICLHASPSSPPVDGRRAFCVLGRVAGRFGADATPDCVAPVSRRRSPTIDNTYNAAHLLVLEGLEAVRKRPGMYIGSTDTRGLMHCLWEIIDNGVDEALAGVAHRVEVTLHDDCLLYTSPSPRD